MLVVALGLMASACNVVAVAVPVVPLAPQGVEVRPEVAAGYERYSAVLSQWGTWEPDDEHGVRWCPRADGPEFTPYVSRGHWGLSEAPIGKSPAGSLAWESEDSDTWGTITTRHGWWVHGSQWCWVPGTEEVAARVIWRWGDGFVGWVAEAPGCVAYDDVEYEALDWFFTLMGTLLDGSPQQNRLDGDAARVARSAAAPARGPGGEPVKGSRAAPPAKSVADARTALAGYAAAHGQTIAQAAAQRSLALKGSSEPSGSSGSKPSSSSAKKVDAKSESRVTAGVYYDAMMMDPMLVPVVGMPQMPARVAPAAGPYASVSRGDGAVGSATSALHASGAKGMPSARGSGGASAAASAGAVHVPSSVRAGGGSGVTYHPSSSSSSYRSSSSGSKSSSKSSFKLGGRSHR
jgi:hypothetical protein